MRTIWHSLAWKEWHEHKWKLASIVAILFGVAVLVLLNMDRQDTFVLAIMASVWCIIPLAVFVGLGAASNEQSRGTLAFLQALPAPLARVAMLKLIFGLITLAAPLFLAAALLYAWSRGLDLFGIEHAAAKRGLTQNAITGSAFLDLPVLGTLIAASLFIWASAAGVNRKDEVSAGAISLAVILGWYVLLMAGGYVLFQWIAPINWLDRSGDRTIETFITALGLSTAAAGFVPACEMLRFGPAEDPHPWIGCLLVVLPVATVTHLALVAWYVSRFGRVSSIGVRSPQAALRERPDWLPPPRGSAASAIAWKQFRESGPLVLAGLAGAVAIVLLVFAGDPFHYMRKPDEFAMLFSGVIAYLGFGVALVVGIGVCLYDVGPQLSTFWRSRPVNADLWFWSKFVTGVTVLMVALYLPLVAIVFLVSDPETVFGNSPVMLMPLVHLAIFAAAVAMTCLVRHAVYAAILSIPTLYLGVVIVWAALNAAKLLHVIDAAPRKMWDMTAGQVGAGFLLTFFVGTILAWLAVRYDWGRKSRY
jgi:hypothetical protein